MRTKPLSTAAPSASSAKIIVSSGGHTATAPAANLVPLELKLKRILVPIDFSKHSQRALEHALAIAGQFGSEIVLVNVIEQFIYPGDWSYLPMPLGEYVSERQDENVEKMATLMKGSKVKNHAIVRIGRAWEEIVNTAKKLKTDLIVIATHGYTGLRHVLVGSVAERVVQHAPCAVLTIRPDERDFESQ
jgi:nucleotide-binding universal stress UspA family protein